MSRIETILASVSTYMYLSGRTRHFLPTEFCINLTKEKVLNVMSMLISLMGGIKWMPIMHKI